MNERLREVQLDPNRLAFIDIGEEKSQQLNNKTSHELSVHAD